ncbi:MAG: hypothetical protein Q8916_09555 [Bacteroidota bacterium]|nr:hypothetical protein [Bacteroidota bacterium]MDP4230634.1 hypothetical protein [Bacteroidota bacterium]MDP4236841.1 hypothetical protein [Bacteroidota bacterium]
MRIDYLLGCILLPLIVSIILTRISMHRLRSNALISRSARSLNVFLVFRFIYWVVFGILISAFLLAIIQTGAGGEQTRAIIARASKTGDGTANFLLSEMSNYFLPAVFVSLFIAVLALGVIGRNVVKLLPEDRRPGEEFSRFRFTFVMMASSLIAPPLAFGSLLLL